MPVKKGKPTKAQKKTYKARLKLPKIKLLSWVKSFVRKKPK